MSVRHRFIVCVTCGLTATLAGYIYTTFSSGKTLSFPVLALIALAFALLSGYIAYRGISGSTMTAIAENEHGSTHGVDLGRTNCSSAGVTFFIKETTTCLRRP